MFWIVTLCVMVFVAVVLMGVADEIDREEMEEEYETEYYIVYK